jgi:hypothetical protein
MDHIRVGLERIEQNMRLNTSDPVARFGFTQMPNFNSATPISPRTPRLSTRCCCRTHGTTRNASLAKNASRSI